MTYTIRRSGFPRKWVEKEETKIIKRFETENGNAYDFPRKKIKRKERKKSHGFL